MTSGHEHTSNDACPECSIEWDSATSIADLGALGARWLEGTLRWQPMYYGAGPDAETLPHVQDLARMNRAGWWTDESQPGVSGEIGAQRARIGGFCERSTALGLRSALLTTELVVLAAPVTGDHDVRIVVSRSDQIEETFSMFPVSGELAAHMAVEYEEHLSELAFAALLDAWYVEVIDMRWGRNDFIWRACLDALHA